jgi:hypothetical protein
MKHVFPSDLVVENETAAALRRTLAFLEERGWCQQMAWGANGQACVGSALSMVAGGLFSPASFALRGATGYGSIVKWNDAESTTWDMVKDAFAKAIEISLR